jgi:hypothetical protein
VPPHRKEVPRRLDTSLSLAVCFEPPMARPSPATPSKFGMTHVSQEEGKAFFLKFGTLKKPASVRRGLFDMNQP